ncbi:peptidase S55 SpoIVB [uncultured Brachyspira sp.]|uniref:peptidase S55 SpoIVB n=1 Tax=uncultured Brachyspira sp. TaxID=221953 RepID=UPI00262F2A0F|nr:peptidase S55 SpoIVB [uncultured Brachyspira sp.]
MVKNIFIIILIFIISLNIYSQENLPAYPPKNPEIISTNDIKIGMEGVGYTVIEGTNIQPFKVKVLSEGRTIIVEAEGLNLEQSGIAVGMNGSPIYFDNKLAGAIYLNYNWEFNKDSTAMLKPIESMHKLYDYSYYSHTNITLSKKNVYKNLRFFAFNIEGKYIEEYANYIDILESTYEYGSISDTNQHNKFFSGDSIFITFMDGDIILGFPATITDSDDEKFLTYIDNEHNIGRFMAPVSRSYVNFVGSLYLLSFNKVTPYNNYLGYTLYRSSDGIAGKYGDIPPDMMIPIKLEIKDDSFPKKEYNYRILNDEDLFPDLLSASVLDKSNRLLPTGVFTINYEIESDDLKEPIKSSSKIFNYSSDKELSEDIMDFLSPIYSLVDMISIKSIKISVNQNVGFKYALLDDVSVVEPRVSAGDTIHLRLKSLIYEEKKDYIDIPVKIPNNLKTGVYTIYIADGYMFESKDKELFPNRYYPASEEDIYKIYNKNYTYNNLKIWFYSQSRGIQIGSSVYPTLPSSRYGVMADYAGSDKQAVVNPVIIKNYEMPYPIIGLKKIDIRIEGDRKYENR